MHDARLTLLMDSHRRELRHLYGDTTWLVSNLRIVVALLEARGVDLTDEEMEFLEAAWRTIDSIQSRIESRLTPRETV